VSQSSVHSFGKTLFFIIKWREAAARLDLWKNSTTIHPTSSKRYKAQRWALEITELDTWSFCTSRATDTTRLWWPDELLSRLLSVNTILDPDTALNKVRGVWAYNAYWWQAFKWKANSDKKKNSKINYAFFWKTTKTGRLTWFNFTVSSLIIYKK
jgi:hypothetical protein